MRKFLSIDDTRWVYAAYREALETPVERQYRLYQARTKASRATVMRKTKLLEKQPRPMPTGDFADESGRILRDAGVNNSSAERIISLLGLLGKEFAKSMSTPNPGDVQNGHDLLGEALSSAFATVFGPTAAFQEMTSATGPIGMAFICHGRTLGRPGAPRMWGPFPADRRSGTCFWRKGHARSFDAWLVGDYLPAIGWIFIGREMKERRSTTMESTPLPATQFPNADPKTYTKAYPWRSLVTKHDYYVCLFARGLAICLRELRSGISDSNGDAIALLKQIAQQDPRESVL
jgi:hypothetical protein